MHVPPLVTAKLAELDALCRLYRLFDFRVAPRLFELDGPIDRHCMLDASTYRASFAA